MKKKIPLELEALLVHFPVIDPPITLSEEVTHKFSSENPPLSAKLISETFARWDTFDEYTELIPCCQLKTDGPFYAIVYWKGSLLTYEYILATIAEDNILINKKVIAGTISNGITVKTSVATIDEDLCVFSAVAEVKTNENFSADQSTAYKFEILPDGKIHASKEATTL